MHPSQTDQRPDDAALAPVIPLRATVEDRAARLDASPWSAPGASDADDLAFDRDWELLRRRYGAQWRDLPAQLGRAAAQLERLLVDGPMAVDADAASPAAVVADAWVAVQAVFAHAPALEEEVAVLGEALGASLEDLPIRELDDIIDAVLALSEVQAGAPSWANPSDAEAAYLVIDAHGADIRTAVDLHADVYRRFTERVWDVREARLEAASRPLRLRSRWLLRRDLAFASRAGSWPSNVREMADLLVGVRASRQRLADLAPLLERHLGRHHQGPRTDVSAATDSLAAVRRLQRALGDRLDVDRLRGLLMADAFVTEDLTVPALSLGAELATWQMQMASLGSSDAWALPINQIGPWANQTSANLPAFAAALSEMESRGHSEVSLRRLVDALLLREHASETEPAPCDLASGATGEGGAS